MVDQLKTLGKYHVLELLSASPLAEIYKVKTVGIAGFEKVQVLKRVMPRYSVAEPFVSAFIEEAKIAFSLNHRNIVQVFEFGKIDEELFLASEYIPGVNLKQVLYAARQQKRAVPVGLACYLMGEVAAGLEYAHHKTDQSNQVLGVLHCDLRPTNIACSFEGSVKILDFGVARAAHAAVPQRDRLQELPRYMSPEQVRGGKVDALSDIFSFGTVLWELLTGMPLFEGNSDDTVKHNIQQAPIPRPRSLNREVPAGLDEAAMRCLERRPERRFASANDLQLELHRIQREVGAVIGSRALSSYLQELLDDINESRDVRQEDPETEPPVLEEEDDRELTKEKLAPNAGGDLIAAAAELAMPQNPPAQSVSEDSAHGADIETSERPPNRSPRTKEARVAGVLRPIHAVDDPSPPPRLRTDRGLDLLSSRDLLEDSAIVEMPPDAEAIPQRSTAEADGPETLRENEPGTSDSLAVETLDYSHSDGPVPALPELDNGTLPAARDELDEPDDSVPHRTADERDEPAVLGERKRFIAVSLSFKELGVAFDEAAELVENIAYKLDGLLHERGEDHSLVIFGLPTYRENDIVSAVRFALDVHEAVSHLSSVGPAETLPDGTSAEKPSVRFGIRAGTARMSSGQLTSQDSYQILGNSLREASALAKHAHDAQILVAGAAARLAASHYSLREGEPLHRHGKVIRCHRVMGPRTGARHRREDAPLIGRELETKAIRNAYREILQRGDQRTVIVVGDAGIGKTRLVDQFIVKNCSDARVITAAATPHRVETPHAVIVNLLRNLTGVWGARGSRSRARLLNRLESILYSTGANEPEVDSWIEALAALFDPGEEVAATSGGFSRTRLYRALREVLHRAAADRPLVIEVENLHWADSSSIECLRTFVQRPGESPGAALLLFTMRPEEGFDSEVFEGEQLNYIYLEELDKNNRQRLIVDQLGERSTDALVEEVQRRAAGNPFLIRELCEAIRQGAEPADVPTTAQGLVVSRVDRLSPEDKVVLQHAAVIGPTFREGILTSLLARNPARSLARLRNDGFLVPSTNMAVAFTASGVTGLSDQFERQWSFRHVLVQEVVYQALHGVDRRQLHRRVGKIMFRRASRGSSDPPGEIARHLELGGRSQEAGEFYLRAANEAAAAYANENAARLYERALQLTESSPELQHAAFAGRERIFGRLGLHDKQAADLLALRRLSGDDPARLADLRTREAIRLLRLGELYRALEAAEQAERAAVEAGDELTRGEALRLRGEAYGRLNDRARAIKTVTKALEIFTEQDSQAHQVRARIALGRIHLLQARYDEAFLHYDPALELIKKTGDRWQERILRNNVAVVHACRGDFSRALAEARCSLDLCQHFGDRAREGDNTSVIGIVYLELGMYDRARTYIENGLAIHRETGSQWSEADTLVYAGLLEAAMRRYQRSLRLLNDAKQLAERMGAKYIAVNARTAIAATLCDRNQPGDAAKAVDEATEGFEMAQNASLVVGEIPGLSRAARATALLGDLEAARALSRRAVELLAEQKIIETAEEEIPFTHFRILEALEDPDADAYLEQAHSGFLTKLALLDDPDERHSLSENVRLFVAIRRDYRARASN